MVEDPTDELLSKEEIRPKSLNPTRHSAQYRLGRLWTPRPGRDACLRPVKEFVTDSQGLVAAESSFKNGEDGD